MNAFGNEGRAVSLQHNKSEFHRQVQALRITAAKAGYALCSTFAVDITRPAWLCYWLLGSYMSDRHQNMDDHEFWTRLEHDASHWLEASDEKTLRQIWADGSLSFSFLRWRLL